MKIFKFGGASVKDAAGIKNVLMYYKRRIRRCNACDFCYGENYKCA
jgi:aspartokinase